MQSRATILISHGSNAIDAVEARDTRIFQRQVLVQILVLGFQALDIVKPGCKTRPQPRVTALEAANGSIVADLQQLVPAKCVEIHLRL